jgi:hypothetical protein
VTQTRPPLRRVNRPTRSHGPVTHREQVLARRRVALIVLSALVPLTLVGALVTGAKLLLICNLIADVAIGVYVAVLLRIKQEQQTTPRWASAEEDEDMRVLPH